MAILAPGRQGEPLDRHVHLGGEVDRREQPPALGLGDRAHRLGRVAEHGDPSHALRVAVGRRAARRRRRRRPGSPPGGRSTGHRAGRRRRGRARRTCHRSPAQQRHQLVRVHEPAPPGLDDLAGVVVERLHRRVGRRREAHGQPAARLVAEAHHRLDRLDPSASAKRPLTTTCSRPRPSVSGAQAPGDRVDLVERQVDRRPDVEHASGSTRAGAASGRSRARRGWRRGTPTSTLSTSGRADRPAVLVAHRGEVAHLGDGDQPLVGLGFVPADAVEEVDVAGRRQAGDPEVRQPPHLQPAGDHRVQPAELDVLLEPSPDRRRRRPSPLGRHPVRPHAVVVGSPEREHLAAPSGRRRRRRRPGARCRAASAAASSAQLGRQRRRPSPARSTGSGR